MKGMPRRKSWTYVTSRACRITTEATLKATTLRTDTMTSISSQVNGKVRALATTSGEPVSSCRKKANYYDSYWYDALGLELSITKNGKACITPTDSFLPGTSFIQGWGFVWDREKSSLQLNVYRMPFFYGKADKPYQELANVLLCLNAAHDTIVVRRSHLVGIDRPVIIPDYLSVPYDAEVCTLRRVKK